MILTIISLLLFSTFSYLISTSMSGGQEGVGSLQVGSLLSSCLLVISVQLGVQTLPLLLSGELFPADVRATCKVVTFQNLNISPSTISESFWGKEVVHNCTPVKSPNEIWVLFAYKYISISLNITVRKETSTYILSDKTSEVREAFKKKKMTKHMEFSICWLTLPPNIWKIYRYFLLSKNDFWLILRLFIFSPLKY